MPGVTERESEIVSQVVDSDAHIGEPPELWTDYLAKPYRARAPRVVLDQARNMRWNLDGRLTEPIPVQMVEDERGQRVPFVPRKGMTDPREHLRDMDVEGIRQAVLYPGMGLLFHGIADPDLATAICRAYNDWLADHCKTDPARLYGAAAIPLQDVAAAVSELTRAVEQLGMRTAFIRPNPIDGRLLHDPTLEPFWRRAADLGVPIAIHEGTTRSSRTVADDRYGEFFFLHMLSHPFEQALACLNLIVGGVLERFPKLRVVFLESGSAWAVHWLERMDEHFEQWGYLVAGLKHKPSDIFRRQCFISTDPDEKAVAATVEFVGEDCVVWASDYPHPDAIFPGAVQATLDNVRLNETQKRKILVDNGRRLYGFA
jgi:uncharacterized protein